MKGQKPITKTNITDTFNFMTGYNHEDPPTSAIGYRLIILESVAGVPGMLGGMFRHFRSLRRLEHLFVSF